MAHLYVVTRGIKHLVDEYIKQLSCKYLPMMVKAGDIPTIDKDQMMQCQVAVRPIQLWEVVYPKEHQDLMLNTVLGGSKGESNIKKLQKYVNMFRKFLGVKPIPDYDTKVGKLPIANADVDITAIGIKEDYTLPNGTEGL